MLKSWCFACCCIAVVSCSGEPEAGGNAVPDTVHQSPSQSPGENEFADVKSVVITQENEEKVGFYIDHSTQLTDEERRLYRSAALRASMEAMKAKNSAMPLTGKTVGQVIEEERKYQVDHGETGSELLDTMESHEAKKKAKSHEEDSDVHLQVYPNQPAGVIPR